MNIIIATLILTFYTLCVCISNKEIPSSLSASVFYLPPKGAWIWTAVIAAVVFLVVPAMIDKAGENWQFLAFLSCAGLLFVAGCPLVKDKSDTAYRVHCAGAILCAVCAQILVAILEPKLLLLWLLWIMAFIWYRTQYRQWRTKTFWAEMICFATTLSMVTIL